MSLLYFFDLQKFLYGVATGNRSQIFFELRLKKFRFHYMNSRPFQYFISLTAHKILEEGFTEWVPSLSSPVSPPHVRGWLRLSIPRRE